MRRFDPSYREMKAALSDGVIGNALMMHNFHRNMQAPDWLTGDMAIANSTTHIMTRYEGWQISNSTFAMPVG